MRSMYKNQYWKMKQVIKGDGERPKPKPAPTGNPGTRGNNGDQTKDK